MKMANNKNLQMAEVYQIEMNKVDDHYYLYLKEDCTVTCNPARAMMFQTYEECEKVRKKMDYDDSFHTQKMIFGGYDSIPFTKGHYNIPDRRIK